MNQNKTIHLPTLMMMDSGMAQFQATSEEDAVTTITSVMEQHGGTCVSREGNHLTFNFSNAFSHQYVTVLVDASEEGRFTASFREGNGPTNLKHYGLLFITLLLMVACCYLMRSWWSLLPCAAFIAIYLVLNYSPSRTAIRRIKKIREELGR